jgi:RNA polymerase sigma-70 factor (ECF subfamily)
MKIVSIAAAAARQRMSVTDDFHEFYQLYSEPVYRTALRVTGNPVDAEDVLQNVFLRFLNRKVSLDPSRSPKAYMRRVATNASIDLLRRKAAKPETQLEEGRDRSTPISSPFLKEMLRSALTKIPPQDAELFVLCYLEGYTYEELSGQFEIERGTIASRLHRIRAVLKKELSL